MKFTYKVYQKSENGLHLCQEFESSREAEAHRDHLMVCFFNRDYVIVSNDPRYPDVGGFATLCFGRNL